MLWAKDGPMSKHLVGPFNIYNHGPIVRHPMGQWRANVYVLSGKPVLLYGSEIWGTINTLSANVKKEGFSIFDAFCNMPCEKLHISNF